MKETLNKLTQHHTLEYEESKVILRGIAEGEYNEHQIASFLTVYMMRSVTLDELRGFRDTLLELCVPVDLSDHDPIDLCGTGGDGKNTFNISTLASFITAGAGMRVAKHGNYGVSSGCGSSDVLQYFGVEFTNDEDQLKRHMDEAGICFLHAPLFHPALKNVGPIRKALGVKTFFNMLGPMVNPSKPNKQMVGVFSLELARIYGYLYQQVDKQFVILHALDGYDEVSLTGETKMMGTSTERIIEPKDFGVGRLDPNEIMGGSDIKTSAKIFVDVLNNEGTEAQRNVACANAAMALSCAYPELNLDDLFALAKDSLQSGKAKKAFEKLVA